jgi:Ca2+/H+ antiporter
MSENQKPPSTPGWVKAFVILLIALVLIVVIAHLLGFRFDHGAGGMLPSNLASYPSLIEEAIQQL